MTLRKFITRGLLALPLLSLRGENSTPKDDLVVIHNGVKLTFNTEQSKLGDEIILRRMNGPRFKHLTKFPKWGAIHPTSVDVRHEVI